MIIHNVYSTCKKKRKKKKEKKTVDYILIT
jgi:hypothetical protein